MLFSSVFAKRTLLRQTYKQTFHADKKTFHAEGLALPSAFCYYRRIEKPTELFFERGFFGFKKIYLKR